MSETGRGSPREAFEEAYDIYRQLFECNPHPMWVYDLATLAFLAVNDAAIARYGYSRDEFLAMTIMDIRPEAERARLAKWIRTDHGSLSRSSPWLHQWKDGTVRNVEISSHEFQFAGRRARLVVADDITEALQARLDLASRAQQQATVAELGQAALATVDVEPLFDLAVRRVADVLDVEFAKVLELVPERSALVLRAGVGWREGLLGQATLEIGPQSQAGFTLQSKDPVIVEDLSTESRFSGPPLLVEHGVTSGLSVVIGDLGAPYGVFGVHTARRRTFSEQDVHFLQSVANLLGAAVQRSANEGALRESEDRFRALFENGLDAVLLGKPEGQVLAANREACRMFMRTEEEMRAAGRRGLADTTDPRLNVLLAEWARTGRTQGECTLIKGDGTRFEGAISCGLFRNRRGEIHASLTVHDLTAVKQAEAKMAEQLQELRRWHDATLGREERVLELKSEVNALLERLGEPSRYASVG